jgi:phosphatidylinositol glycan class B
MFAAVYYVAAKPMELLGFFPMFQALILSRLPNLVQACFAALGDYYTWKMSEKIYGKGSNSAWAAVSETLWTILHSLIVC